jgi:SAM-dependent methyltransferase
MRAVSKRYENLMATIEPAQGKLAVPFFSSVTGCPAHEAAALGPSYWRSNMENPVLFLSAVESALHSKAECNIALEIGPHSTLSGPFSRICKEMKHKIQYVSTLTRGTDCTNAVLTSLGHLFCHGLLPRLSELNPPGITLSNLPTYPWNHNTPYWHESRISREFRLREYPEHELLGVRSMGGNDHVPSWRKLLDVDKVLWISDHVVAGEVIFPGAGYIAMVGEAIRQLAKSSSYMVRNLSIEAAMMLRSGQPTEIITTLHPHTFRTTLHSSSWYDFTVSSYNGSKWSNHCSGEVRIGQNSKHTMFLSNIETIRQVKGAQWYQATKAAGLAYGPKFQMLQNIQCAVGKPVASAKVYGDLLPKGSLYAVHPIAIDQLLQCCMVGSLQGQLRNMNKLVLPIHIGELRVMAQEGKVDLQLRTQVTSHSSGSILANGQIWVDDGSTMMQCEGIRFRTLDDNNAIDKVNENALHKVQLLEWKPDVDLVDANELLHRTSDLTSCIRLVEELHILCEIETARVLKNLESSKPHMNRFKKWIEEFVTTIQHHGSTVVKQTEEMFRLTPEERQTRIQSLLEEAVETPAKDIALTVASIHENAEDIFCGRKEALAVLFADDLLTRFYNFLNMVNHEQFLQLLGHSNPGLRILEIGAGTGGFTSTVLPALNKPGYGYMYSNYTYTDISSGFFKAAKERFNDFPNLEFAKLDIGQDMASQGIQQNSYDLVIAANVLHATPSLHNTLSNCRALLRPGGRLLLLELCCSEAKFINYAMGFLPGWWLGESECRPNEPFLQPAQWDLALRNAGFDGIEASITDQPAPCQLDAVMIARASQPAIPRGMPLSLLLSDLSVVDEGTRTVRSKFESYGYHVSLCSLSNLPSSPVDIVSLLEIDGSGAFFEEMSETRFNGLIQLIEQGYHSGKKILWVTGPAQIHTEDPYRAMILGLARTLRLELGSVFGTLELESLNPDLSQLPDIVRVFRKLETKPGLSFNTLDYEYAVANGHVCIPRFITSDVDGLLRKSMDSTQGAKRLVNKSPGLLNGLQWGLQSRVTFLADDELELEVRSASMNARVSATWLIIHFTSADLPFRIMMSPRTLLGALRI